jgi:hypothetical protein
MEPKQRMMRNPKMMVQKLRMMRNPKMMQHAWQTQHSEKLASLAIRHDVIVMMKKLKNVVQPHVITKLSLARDRCRRKIQWNA